MQADQVALDLLGATPAERDAVYAQLKNDFGDDFVREVRRIVEQHSPAAPAAVS